MLLAWEGHARGDLSPRHGELLAGLAIAVLLGYGLAKAYKRRWLFAG